LRQRTAAVPEPEHLDHEDGDDVPPVQSEYGLSLWSRVATLTVSVSKAWASNITTHSGAETPPGEESRLTRAMKAYHLEKARDPADLPPWLFEEHERRQPSVSTWDREASGPGVYESRDDNAPPRGRGLRDVYDAAAATTPTPPRQERREMSRGRQDDVDDAGHSSKANNRLKALRDAKRDAVQRNASFSGRLRSTDDDAKRDAIQRNASFSGRLQSTNDERSSARKEYRRGYEPDGRPGVPSLPTSIRPGVGSGLSPRPSTRK